MAKMANGSHIVDSHTSLIIKKGVPFQVCTSRYDLDRALDDAAQYWGAPIERCGPWLTDDGRDIDGSLDKIGKSETLTCKVREVQHEM